MKKHKLLPYIVFILLSLAVGGAGALAVMRGLPAYMALEKPPLTPPAIVFPIVWSVLYVLMGVGAARVWLSRSRFRSRALAAYGFQLVLNVLWVVWFFGLGARLLAFWWLLALQGAVVLMIWTFFRVDRPAGLLQLPYLLWCVFAAYLNLGVWLLNR